MSADDSKPQITYDGPLRPVRRDKLVEATVTGWDDGDVRVHVYFWDVGASQAISLDLAGARHLARALTEAADAAQWGNADVAPSVEP